MKKNINKRPIQKNQRAHVLGIGQIVLDKSLIINEFPTEGCKLKAKQIQYSIGGPVPSALILLSKLGIKCTLICAIADDEAGKILQNQLKKYQINLIIYPQEKTHFHTVLVNKQTASRTIIKDQIKTQLIKNISQEIISSAGLIIFDRHEPLAFQEVMVKKKKDTPVIIDPSTDVSEQTILMLQQADHAILPIESLDQLEKRNHRLLNLINLKQRLKKRIVITAGELGSFSFDGLRIHIYPAYQIKAVDSLGAGDVFRAAYSYGLIKRWPLNKIIDYANLVAALQCTKLGNGSAIPNQNEITQFQHVAQYKNISIKDFTLTN